MPGPIFKNKDSASGEIFKPLRKHPDNNDPLNKEIPEVNDWMVGYFLANGDYLLRGQIEDVELITTTLGYYEDTYETAAAYLGE